MKFAIASVSYWDSIGMDSTKWRKSLDGTKALCHLSYAERLGINLHATPEVDIYDSVDTEFEELLISPEWSETSATGDPDSFSILNELNQFETNINNAVSQKTADLTAQLQHMEIEVFNEIPSTSQLKEGKFGFVIDVAQQQYDDLNLSFERLNANNFPFLFAASPVGGGVKIVETHLSEIKSTDGTFRSMRIGQKGGDNGSSNYSRLNTAQVIPLDGSKKIIKSDLINFRFSVKPISENCYDGSGTYNGSVAVRFRNGAGGVLGSEATHFFTYNSFSIPSHATADKVAMDEWTIVKWDLHEACKKRGINFDLVEGIVLTFNAYTNHSAASCEYLVDDISFGV